MKFIRSKCNEGCNWCIYLTEVTCADTMTHILCIQKILWPEELLHSDICHLLISGEGVKITIDILCESDGYHCKLPVSPYIL